MTNEDLKRLEMLAALPALRQGLDEALSSYVKETGGMLSLRKDKVEKSGALVDAVNSLLMESKKSAKDDREYAEIVAAVKTYISLDLMLYLALVGGEWEAVGRKLELETDICESTEPLGRPELWSLYNNKDFHTTEALEKNSKILPRNTQKYVEWKKRQREVAPEMTRIMNEFEYRTYLQTLAEEYDHEAISAAQNVFGNETKLEDRPNSLLYFMKALAIKYGAPNENKELEVTFDRAARGLAIMIMSKLKPNGETRPGLEDFKRALGENRETARLIAKSLEKLDNRHLSRFFREFI